jgi:hypothetical protein
MAATPPLTLDTPALAFRLPATDGRTYALPIDGDIGAASALKMSYAGIT